MKNRNRFLQLIPEKIHDEISLIESLIKPTIKGYLRANLLSVISIVAFNVRKSGKPAQLQMEHIKKMVPQGDKYLKGLRDLNIVIRSGQYVPGERSYKYIFARKYQSKYLTYILSDSRLIIRIQQARLDRIVESTKLIRGYSEQTKFLRSMTINDGCFDFIQTNYTVDTVKFNFAQSSATRILNGDISYSVDNTSGRFHSNITNMPKGLRKYLRIGKEPLVNIDIKNSQPFLSILLLTNPAKVSGMTRNPDFARLLQNLKVKTSPDVKKYIDLVISGQIYEFLTEEFLKEGMDLPEDPKECRGVVKVQVLRILFAPNMKPDNQVNRKARQIFINRFPAVHKTFSIIRGNEKGDKFQSFKRFAILLQSMEAHLILKVILKRIDRELPGTIAVTIHDSIMTGLYTNNVEAVSRIMKEELTLFVGFEPKIKVER